MRSTLLAAVTLASTVVALPAVQAPAVQWEPLTSGVAVRLRGIAAVSADLAWASGERGTVLRTTDGGRTGSRARSPAPRPSTDAVRIAPGGRVGFASGAGGRLARVTFAR